MPINRTNARVIWLWSAKPAAAAASANVVPRAISCLASITRRCILYACGGNPISYAKPLSSWKRLMPASVARSVNVSGDEGSSSILALALAIGLKVCANLGRVCVVA